MLRTPLPLDDELVYRCVLTCSHVGLEAACNKHSRSERETKTSNGLGARLDRFRLDPKTRSTGRGTAVDTSVRLELTNGAVMCSPSQARRLTASCKEMRCWRGCPAPALSHAGMEVWHDRSTFFIRGGPDDSPATERVECAQRVANYLLLASKMQSSGP